ncbi:ribbon-helix-helix protein, CopG family [Duganella sp. FT50W]|uniref:Ribbon-helix-helix protein, CopG family n=1 Tax=Duganella lactea TaxID=2692173 RepID=A0A6L8MLR3_9BURK|nr:ribbon-helix-helix protein, CopG family [Duganella lactea]MYM84130.1 ribbon-helix-helix protein, CopG family [Duganella lactea]
MDAKKRPITVRLSLDMSPEANDLLERLASANGTTKSQILRRAVALYHVAHEATVSGKRIGVIDKDRNVVTEFVGL